MQRVVNTTGGIILDGKHAPEGTKISVHGWSVHHDPRYFGKPWDFIPERWIRLPRQSQFCRLDPLLCRHLSVRGPQVTLLEIRILVYMSVS